MADSTPPSILRRWFRACLLILGGILLLWIACWALAQFWGWLLLALGIALMLWCGAAAYRYWWSRR